MLTEVVHCKSRNEAGVAAAAETCAGRYLTRVLAASGARVVVVLGAVARREVRRELGLSTGDVVVGPTRVAGRERMLAFLPAPNARQPKTFANVMPEALPALRAFLEATPT